MNVFAIDLRPKSDFATNLTGDCLFGQICWQLAQDSSLAGNLGELLEDYDLHPFAVISDPVMSFKKGNVTEYLLLRPFVPSVTKPFAALSFEQQKTLFAEKKRRKGCRWVIVSEAKQLDPTDSDAPVNKDDIISRYSLNEDWQPDLKYYQHHNSIDRLTGTTGTDAAFAPFAQPLSAWAEGTDLTLFVALSNKLPLEAFLKALSRIGATGYGADASTGKGRFTVLEAKPFDLSKLGDKNPNAVYTMSSALPAKEIYSQVCFEPAVRFGRHGNYLANSEFPFKQPVLKAAAAAVFRPIEGYWPQTPYVGRSIRGLSKFPETVEQGYSLYIPVKLEDVA